jgi:hypothetical protein
MTHSGRQTNDKCILRELARKVAEIASLPVHEEKRKMWCRLNRLQDVKPMIWINEVCWNEMNVDDELTLKTSTDFCRDIETKLLRIIYQWEHFRGDMIVDPWIECPIVVHDSGFGISTEADLAVTDRTSEVVSRHYHPQIRDESDIWKIKMSEVTRDQKATDENYGRMLDIFDSVLPVRIVGRPGFIFHPWDELVEWYGVQEALTDLLVNPRLIHMAIGRLVEAHLHRLDQYEALGLLEFNNGNFRIGSGGLGYTDELPQADFHKDHARPRDLWGSATAQIFGEVSPEMHEEFALQYELKWMTRFGLIYYGCCEPLHRKIDMLGKIPMLRKISISPWANVDESAEKLGGRYVYSFKPNPAALARGHWDPESARNDLLNTLRKARSKSCVVEVIMKDISTVRYQPQRLWEWARIAEEVCDGLRSSPPLAKAAALP